MVTKIITGKDFKIIKEFDSLILFRFNDVLYLNAKQYLVSVTTFDLENEILNVIVNEN